jgi:cyclic pyranopterin phosphate synthase
MEALTATTSALLTVWDMTKKYEKDERGQYPSTMIKDIRVLRKTKGEQSR